MKRKQIVDRVGNRYTAFRQGAHIIEACDQCRRGKFKTLVKGRLWRCTTCGSPRGEVALLQAQKTAEGHMAYDQFAHVKSQVR